MCEKSKICPICKKEFTRKQLGLSKQQWFLRVYCSIKCYSKTRRKKHWGFGEREYSQ